MEAWDNDRTDVDRLLNRVIHGVMHHPAHRDQGEDGARDGRSIMFRTVEEWWNEKDSREKQDYRRKLSREGVERGENHKEGVHDTGHGCGKPLGMHKQFGGSGGTNTMEDKIATAAAGAIIGGVTSGISGVFEDQTGYKLPTQSSQGSGPWASGGSSQQESGGIGGLIGGLLGSAFKSGEKTRYQSSGRTDDGAYQQTTTEYGHHGNRYAQAEEKVTEYPGGERRTEFSEFEQQETGGRHGGRRHDRGSGYVEETETQPVYGGGYQQHTERKWEDNRGEYRREEETSTVGGGFGGGPRGEYASGRQQETYGGGRQQEEYGGRRQEEYGGRQQEEYGGRQQEEYGGGRRDEFQGGGRGGWGGGEERREESGGWGGERREEYGERREEGGGGFGGGMFGGGGGNIVEQLAEEVAEEFGGSENRRGRGDGEERREGGWGF